MTRVGGRTGGRAGGRVGSWSSQGGEQPVAARHRAAARAVQAPAPKARPQTHTRACQSSCTVRRSVDLKVITLVTQQHPGCE
jgi:hypothetical protein